MTKYINEAEQKYWAYKIDGNTLFTEAGKIGKPGRQNEKSYTEHRKLKSELDSKLRKLLYDGYVFHAPESNSLLLQLGIEKTYTGFLDFDFLEDKSILVVPHTLGNERCQIVFIDLASGRRKETMQLNYFDLQQVKFTLNGDALYFRADKESGKINLATKTVDKLYTTNVFKAIDIQLSDDNSKLLVGNNDNIEVHDVKGGTILFSQPHPSTRDNGSELQVRTAMSNDGKLLAISEKKGKITIYDINKNTAEKVITGDFGFVNKMEFHPSGNFLVLNVEGYLSVVWDITANCLVAPPDNDPLYRKIYYNFSSAGTLLAVPDTYGKIDLWTFPDYTHFGNIKVNEFASRYSVKFTADNSMMITRNNLGIIEMYSLPVKKV